MALPPSKTLYQLLGLTPDASAGELEAAYRRLLSPGSGSREDEESRLKSIKLAYEVLSDPAQRTVYDAGLREAAGRGRPLQEPSPATFPDAASSLGKLRPMRVLRPTIAILKIVLLLILTMMLGLGLRNAYMLSSARNGDIGEMAKRAEQKAAIQAYYQDTGIRVGSMSEADILSAIARKKDAEERERELQRAKEEREYRNFVEDGRREGERVSYELQEANARARQQEEYARERAEADRRAREEAEKDRIEREREKWRQQLEN